MTSNTGFAAAISEISDNFRNSGLLPESASLASAALIAWSQLPDAVCDEAKVPGFWMINVEIDADGWDAVIACLKTQVCKRSPGLPVDEFHGLAAMPLAVIVASWQAVRSALLQGSDSRWRDLAIDLLHHSPSWMGGADDPSKIALVFDAALKIAPRSTIYCFGDATADLAIHWGRKSHDVRLDVSNWRFAMVVALLAVGANAYLSVDVYGSGDEQKHKSDCERMVIAPPFNSAIWGKPSERMPWAVDARLYDRLIGQKLMQVVVVVPDGFLFRTTSGEQALKQRLIEEFGLTAVVSLPKGQMAATIGCALLVHKLAAKCWGDVLFIDGRSVSDGHSEMKIANILRSRDESAISRVVSDAELEKNSFNLLVDRYIRPAGSEEHTLLFEGFPTISLEDVAEFSRPPVLSVSKGDDADQIIYEVVNGDIQDGVVRQPRKKVATDRQTYAKCKRAFLRPGDIVFSVKGRLGVVGLVTEEALSGAEGPWSPNQSFVTLRMRPGTAFLSPAVLAAVMGSPMIQEVISARSVGSTVPSLQIADVKNLAVPLLNREMQEHILSKLAEIDSLRRQRNKIARTIEDKLKQFWPSVLG